MAEVRDAVICEPVRTAVGRLGGMFRDVPVERLAATVIEELVERTGVDGERIEDVILGQCYPNGEAPAPGGARGARPQRRSISLGKRPNSAR
jgi:acetyl-CoA C-acetyltransferase